MQNTVWLEVRQSTVWLWVMQNTVWLWVMQNTVWLWVRQNTVWLWVRQNTVWLWVRQNTVWLWVRQSTVWLWVIQNTVWLWVRQSTVWLWVMQNTVWLWVRQNTVWLWVRQSAAWLWVMQSTVSLCGANGLLNCQISYVFTLLIDENCLLMKEEGKLDYLRKKWEKLSYYVWQSLNHIYFSFCLIGWTINQCFSHTCQCIKLKCGMSPWCINLIKLILVPFHLSICK